MILTLFILTAISLLLFYNIDYKYYKSKENGMKEVCMGHLWDYIWLLVHLC